MNLRIISALFLFICASVSVVSAAEPQGTYERLSREKAKAAAEWYCDTISMSDNRDRLEVREIVPGIFVNQIYNCSYTPAEMVDQASAYLAVLWEYGTPKSLLIIWSSKSRPINATVSVRSSSDAVGFLNTLERIRAHMVSDDICLIMSSHPFENYFYIETESGSMAIPTYGSIESADVLRKRYTDDILIPRDEFEVAYTEYMHFLYTASVNEIPMGSMGIMERLPPMKLKEAIDKAIPIAVGIVIGMFCCAVICITLERSRKHMD